MRQHHLLAGTGDKNSGFLFRIAQNESFSQLSLSLRMIIYVFVYLKSVQIFFLN